MLKSTKIPLLLGGFLLSAFSGCSLGSSGSGQPVSSENGLSESPSSSSEKKDDSSVRSEESSETHSSFASSEEGNPEEVDLLADVPMSSWECWSQESEGDGWYTISDRSIIATFANSADSIAYWSTQIKYSALKLVAGETYTFHLSIVSSLSRKVEILLQDFTNGNYGEAYITDVIALTAGETYDYTVKFTPETSVTCLFGLMLGAVDGNVYPETHTVEMKNAEVWGISSARPEPVLPDEEDDEVPPSITIGERTYDLYWSDEFSGDALNSSYWTYDVGTGSNGWGNNEKQYYTQGENLDVSNGVLNITARKENRNGCAYTSSRIKTLDKVHFTYGYVEARIKTPLFSGAWPAFWMLGNNIETRSWPFCGEIDIYESVNLENVAYATCHWNSAGSGGSYSPTSYGLSVSTSSREEWHRYSILWTEQSIIAYLDGSAFYEIDITPENLDCFHQDFFILFDLAVGGNWPGFDIALDDEATMSVDYVRVYR